MHILKSSIALVLLLSACQTYVPVNTAQQLLPVPSHSIKQAPNTVRTSVAPSIQPRRAGEVAFMKAQMNTIQPRSIAEDREYCGYLGLLANGDFAISPPMRGAPAGCTPNTPPANMRVIASYHTHAAYAPHFDSEVPSATDLEGDISDGINGYVSTPGGRLWYSDGAAQKTFQLCGVGCLPSDPRFRPEVRHPVRQSYSLARLRQRQN